jgi:hypothetical protein
MWIRTQEKNDEALFFIADGLVDDYTKTENEVKVVVCKI